MAASMAKSVKSIFSSICGKTANFSARNLLVLQRNYASTNVSDFKQEEFRLEYLEGDHEGRKYLVKVNSVIIFTCPSHYFSLLEIIFSRYCFVCV